MGNKPGRTRKYILHFLALGGIIAAFLNMVSCSQVQNRLDAVKAWRLESRYRDDLRSGYYEAVILRSKRILRENETQPPADVALYALGETYAHPDFAGRDYELSRSYFEKLIEDFPDSPLSSEAGTFVSLLEKIAAEERKIASLENKRQTAVLAREMIGDRDFAKAVQENLRILEQDGKSARQNALYNLGLIYAHVDNPAKDYGKSRQYFRDLIKEFPESNLAEEARIWLGLFEVFEKMQRIDMEIEEQKKQLTR